MYVLYTGQVRPVECWNVLVRSHSFKYLQLGRCHSKYLNKTNSGSFLIDSRELRGKLEGQCTKSGRRSAKNLETRVPTTAGQLARGSFFFTMRHTELHQSPIRYHLQGYLSGFCSIPTSCLCF